MPDGQGRVLLFVQTHPRVPLAFRRHVNRMTVLSALIVARVVVLDLMTAVFAPLTAPLKTNSNHAPLCSWLELLGIVMVRDAVKAVLNTAVFGSPSEAV